MKIHFLVILFSVALCGSSSQKQTKKVQSVTDTSYNSYELVLDDLCAGCLLTKKSRWGVQLWSKNYDDPNLCQGKMLQISPANELYAVLKVLPGSVINKRTPAAATAFSTGLWTNMGETLPISILDLIVQINTSTGDLLKGTFLMSKFCSPDIQDCASHPLEVTQPITFTSTTLQLLLKSEAYPPDIKNQQNKFYFLTNADGDYSEDEFVSYSILKNLSGFKSASYQNNRRILIRRSK